MFQWIPVNERYGLSPNFPVLLEQVQCLPSVPALLYTNKQSVVLVHWI